MPACGQVTRQGEAAGDGRLGPVKGGIETADLHEVGMARRDGPHPGEVVGLV